VRTATQDYLISRPALKLSIGLQARRIDKHQKSASATTLRYNGRILISVVADAIGIQRPAPAIHNRQHSGMSPGNSSGFFFAAAVRV